MQDYGNSLIKRCLPKQYESELRNRSRGGKVRCASNHLFVSVYRVPQMQGVGDADLLLYFKCPTKKQMRCPVNAYGSCMKRKDLIKESEKNRFYNASAWQKP